MKGRRKIKTDKWNSIHKTERAARKLLEGRAHLDGYFLDIAARIGKKNEPNGRLAG